MAIDWDDPCATLASLREAYEKILTGSQEERVRFSDREVQYSKADIATLRDEIRRYDALCADATNAGTGKRRRFAVTAGTRRRG